MTSYFPDEIAKRDFGAFLKTRRVAAGVTQRDLSDALGYASSQFVSNWERGVSAPPADVLPFIGEKLGVSMRDMIRAVHEFHAAAARRQKKELERLLRPRKRGLKA